MRTSPVAGFLAGTALASALVGGAAWAASVPTPAPAATTSAITAAPAKPTASAAAAHTGHAGARGHAALLHRASHGQLTLTTKKGDRTVLVQRGTVTAVTQPSGATPGAVTGVSTDRFSATYALPSAAKVRLAPAKGATTPAATTTVKVGERVRLLAHIAPGGGTASIGAVRVLPARPAGAPAAGN